MNFLKVSKDKLARALLGTASVPRGLFELNQYFRHYAPINFKYHNEEGRIVAVSTNFRFGSIITSGSNNEELDENIKDAILTSFEIPSSYKKEASIRRVEGVAKEYALA